MGVRDEHREADVAVAEEAPPHPSTAERGASAVEYALLLGLMAIVIFAAVALLGVNTSDLYSSIATGF